MSGCAAAGVLALAAKPGFGPMGRTYIGLATDGDGDRIGAIDADGRYITPYQIFCLLMKYLVEKRDIQEKMKLQD